MGFSAEKIRASSAAEAGNPAAALKEWALASSSSSSDGRLMAAAGRYGAFFLIKNLDTGKEFVVNEYGVHRGVGGTTTAAGGGGFAVNSLIYKSLRTSNRWGVALIKGRTQFHSTNQLIMKTVI